MSDEINLGQLGEQRFNNFCQKIKELLVDKKIKFNLVVAVGNSGLVMGRFTELIYEYLGLNYPSQLSAPFYRFLPGHREDMGKVFDSSVFLPEVIKQIKDISHIKTVLFVDDEIGNGITATTCLKLIQEALKQLNRSSLKQFYIVAEDQGFKVPKNMPEIVFIPYGHELEGYNNVIFFMSPWEMEKPLIDLFGDDDKLPFHHRTNILLNLPVKDFNNGSPIYTKKYLETAKEQIPNFKELQDKYEEHTKNLIKLALSSNGA